ncbi:MAG: discoidin domain-containing protein [Nitrospirales bacterium]
MIDEGQNSGTFGYLQYLPFDPGQIIEVEFRARVLSGESANNERAPFRVWLSNGLFDADLSVGPDSITSLGRTSGQLLINEPIDGDNWHVYRYRVTSRGIEWWVDGNSIGTATVDMLIPHYTDSGQRINMFISSAVANVELDFLRVTATMDPIPPMNQPPTVNAGPPQTIILPNNAQLGGTVTHDGLPGPTVTTTWSKLSGPGTVTFGNVNSRSTAATFSETGTYVLRLTADDGVLSASAEVTMAVILPRPPTPLAMALRDRGLHDADGIPGGDTVRLIYDEDLNITWLGDANFAKTSGFDADGQMNWASAMAWADSLTVGGFTNWRLPTTTQPDLSCSIQSPSGGSFQYCTGSEFGHLYHTELGGFWFEINGRRILKSFTSVPFTNVQENGNPFLNAPFEYDFYWSGTEDSLMPDVRAWSFAWGGDNQDVLPKDDGMARFAWAVRDGDVPPVLSVLSQGLLSIVPPSSFDHVVGYLFAGAIIPEALLDGRSDGSSFWGFGSAKPGHIPGNGDPKAVILALGGDYLISGFRYLPYSWTKCTQYEVYVSATDGNWGSPVASGTWANDSTEKTVSFPPTPGAFLRIRFLNNYCYAAELNVVGVAMVNLPPPQTPLSILPTMATVPPRGQQAFMANGGVLPYSYSVLPGDTTGGANINALTGLYTAGPLGGASTVRVTDANLATADATVMVTGATSVISQALISAVSASSDAGNRAKVLDGKSTTFWGATGSSPHEMVLALGGDYLISEFRYLPFSWTKCTQFEVYVSATNGNWGSPVASGTWANDSTEKTVSFPPTPGAFLRIRYLNPYCYAAEHNVVGVAMVNLPPPQTPLSILPATVTVPVGSQQAFMANGGVLPYSYSVLPGDTTGGANINALTGLYTAGPLGGASTVRVTDGILATADAAVTVTGATSVIPQGQISAVSASSDAGNRAKVLDGKSTTFWGATGSSPHEMVLALGGDYLISEFRYLPFSWTKCTQYEVYVSATNGNWGSPVASGTWADDSTEKTVSFPPTPGAFLRIRYLNPYCYAAEHNVVGAVLSGGN